MESFTREILEQLGNLFYAIAKDQHVAPLQFGELKMLLRKDWLIEPLRITNDGVTEGSHLIVLTMDTLQAQAAPSEEAFDSFTRFYKKHREQFSAALKKKIISAAEAITEVFPSGSRLKNNHIIKAKLLFQNSSLVA